MGLLVLAGIFLLGFGVWRGVSLLGRSPGTNVPNGNFGDSFDVSASADPVSIEIPALKINAPVGNLGLNQDGSLQVPRNDGEVGWYSGGVRPGEEGPAIMVGHLDSKNGAAVFWRLKNLKPGDEVRVGKADGGEVVFKVDKLENHDQNSFPSEEVYRQHSGRDLRLITCAGRYDRKIGRYSENLVVFASAL